MLKELNTEHLFHDRDVDKHYMKDHWPYTVD